MLRKKQKFIGELTDEDLYLIEDALTYYQTTYPSCKINGLAEEPEIKKIKKLILKLYENFWEKPKGMNK